KNYTKTKPLVHEEFADCATWWGGRERAGRRETAQAWQVATTEIVESGYNLDRRNPNRPDDLSRRPPAELVAELIETEREMLGLLEDLEREIKDFAQ
ncbi:MAG: hypothetical protein L0H59_17075, partial [Tomitella sp.]|nr:hypothetical protein [Tomitella sp.]